MDYDKFLARVRCYQDDEKPAPVDRAGCLPEIYAIAESAIHRRDGFWFAILCGVGTMLAGSGIGIYMGVGHGALSYYSMLRRQC